MKKSLILVLALALVMLFALAACDNDNDAPADTTGDTGDAAADEDQVYTLTFSYFGPENIPPGYTCTNAMEQITEETDGKVVFDPYFNGTLLSTEDCISGCINGTADIIFCESSQIGEVFPLNNVFSMPYTNTPPDKVTLDAVYTDMVASVPELQAELEAAGLRWLSIMAIAGYNLHGTAKDYQTVADVTNQKIEGLGKGGAMITAMGGLGQTLDPGDYYLSLSTGLLDGQLTHWAALGAYGTIEELTTHTVFANTDDSSDIGAQFGGGLYAPAMGTVINFNTWNNLPEEYRAIVDAAFDAGAVQCTQEDFNGLVKNTVQAAIDRGDAFIFITDAERPEWVANLGSVLDAWYAQCSKTGGNGEEVYQAMMEKFAAAAQ